MEQTRINALVKSAIPAAHFQKPEVSIVVPFFNEEDNIERVYRAIVCALEPSGLRFEMVFVDDGSGDQTFARAVSLAAADSRVRVIKFRRNFGQTPAMAAGIREGRGDILVTMDGDLQNDPLDIPIFLDRIKEGYDLVVGWRHARKDKLITRKIPSQIANWLIGKVTGVPIKDNGCSLKAYRSDVIKCIPLYSEMHRFIPAMASISGSRIAEVKVRHHARKFGSSKYGISRVYKVLLDLIMIKTITGFSVRPFRWFLALSIPCLFIGLTMFIYALIYATAIGGGLPFVIVATASLFSMCAALLILNGVIAEWIYKTGGNRDDFFIRSTMRVWPRRPS